MSATRILWGQIAVVFLIVLAAMWAATQWTAWQLGFQPQLGQPWFELARGVPVYLPPAFFWWWYAYDAYAPQIFLGGAYIATSGAFLSIAVAIGLSVWRAREAKKAETYGSARWATQKEIRAAGLLGADGVVLGRFQKDYLRHDGPEHVLCFAPTRSGKGVGLVVPTLLTWPGSAIVHDIKGENWTLTAGFRARHGRVLLFDPTNSKSSAYNPLLEIRRGASEVRDAQNVADILVDPDGSLERRNHWEKTSHSLLVGVILHVLYAESDKTLAGVAHFLADPSRSIEATLRAMMSTRHLGQVGPHPVIASAARELWNKSENERSGVLSTAMSFLALYRDPVVAQATRGCDWRIADLVDGARPTTLYLVVPPSDISRTKPLIRLILNQVGRRLTEDLNAKNRRHRLLLMLDEFPALGRLDFFESALAFMAGYGLRSFLIAQSLNQIEKAYGANNSILDNCHVRVSFATNDERTAKRVSDALGTATEIRAMKNYAGHRLSPWLGHLMVSRQETARPLLTAGEVMQLPSSDEIVMMSGAAPTRLLCIFRIGCDGQVPIFLLLCFGGVCRAVFESEAVVSGFKDVTVVGQAVEQCGRHLGISSQWKSTMTVLSSPKLLASKPLARPTDITSHELIESVTRPQDWQAWLKLANVNNAIVAGGHRFDHLFVAMQAVKDGLGSSVAPQNLFQIAIANHELACPFPHLNFQGESYFAYFAGGSIDPIMKRFKTWLVRKGRPQDPELTESASVLEHTKRRHSTMAKRESAKKQL